MYKLEAGPGDHFTSVVKRAQEISHSRNEIVEFDFNGVKCRVNNMYLTELKDRTNPEFLYRDYSNALSMGWETVGPNCVPLYDKKTQKAIEKKEAEDKAELEEQRELWKKEEDEKAQTLNEKIGDIEMSFKDKELWERGVENNQDAYGGACYSYAESWAKLMQYEIQKFQTSVKDVAKQASFDADVEGITGFMYGMAVNILSQTWEHGEELRKWHNGEYGHEGDGVVNPAVLTIGKKEE